MWYKHLIIMWHSGLPSERNNNPCNFKDKCKCQSCKNLANSFISWKFLVIKGKRSHWKTLSADCLECIMSIQAGAGRCSLQCPSRNSWGKHGWFEVTHIMKTYHAPSWSNNHSTYPILIYTVKLIGLMLKLLSNHYHHNCIFSPQNCMQSIFQRFSGDSLWLPQTKMRTSDTNRKYETTSSYFVLLLFFKHYASNMTK